LETEIADRFLDDRHVPLVGAVEEDVALRCDDEERAERLRSDVVDVGDDFVRRKLRRLVFGCAHVARQNRPPRVGLTVHGDRWVIGTTLLRERRTREQEKRGEYGSLLHIVPTGWKRVRSWR